MVFIGDKLFTWDQRAPDEEIPDLPAAIAEHRSGSSVDPMRTIEEGEAIPWNSWNVKGYRAPKEQFVSLLAFFVNLPDFEERYRAEEKKWLWRGLSKQAAISQLFNLEEPPGTIFKSSPSLGNQLQSGWLLAREYGRVDEDTTDSATTYLLETERCYLYFRYYQMTLH